MEKFLGLMVFGACRFPKMQSIQSEVNQQVYLLAQSPLSSPPSSSNYQKEVSPASSSGSKISPALLFVVIILAVVFFVSGVLHLFVKFLVKHRSSSSVSRSNRYPEVSDSNTFQRQLQQLFNLHDSGLDQAFVDALPVFLYEELMGLKEQFDCAVCLCEFAQKDKLRLLPLGGHAFHIDCIDTWLLSNSTCPLCRGNLFMPGYPIENTIFDFQESEDFAGFSGNLEGGASLVPKSSEHDIGKRVFSVRLGKFKNMNSVIGGEAGGRGDAEASSSNLEARRCYSMGSYQYVVADSELQVSLCSNRTSDTACPGDVRIVKGENEPNGKPSTSIIGDFEGKEINSRSKGESFSISKTWLWSKKAQFSSSVDPHIATSSGDVSLMWKMDRIQATR